MTESLVKLAQVLDDAFVLYHKALANKVERGDGLEDLYALRSKVSDCIAAIELKNAAKR